MRDCELARTCVGRRRRAHRELTEVASRGPRRRGLLCGLEAAGPGHAAALSSDQQRFREVAAKNDANACKTLDREANSGTKSQPTHAIRDETEQLGANSSQAAYTRAFFDSKSAGPLPTTHQAIGQTQIPLPTTIRSTGTAWENHAAQLPVTLAPIPCPRAHRSPEGSRRDARHIVHLRFAHNLLAANRDHVDPLEQKRIAPSGILADPLRADMPSIAVVLDGETSFGPVEVGNVITF